MRRALFVVAFFSGILRRGDASEGRYVRDCASFVEAIETEDVEWICIDGDVVCSSAEIPSATTIARDLQIVGVSNEDVQSALDLRDVVDSVSVGIDRLLLLANIVVYLSSGLELQDAIVGREGSVVLLDQVTLVQSDCATTAYSRAAKMESTELPVLFDKMDQNATARDAAAVFVGSYGARESTPSGTSYIYVCNSLYLCSTANAASNPLAVVGASEPTSCRSLLSRPGKSSLAVLRDLSLWQTLLLAAALGAVIALLSTACHRTCQRASRLRPRISCGLTLTVAGSKKSESDAVAVEAAEMEVFKRLERNNPLADVHVLSLIGHGAFGKVYKALWRGTTVALKVIAHGEDDGRKKPLEALVSKNIAHPHIVQSFAVRTAPIQELLVESRNTIRLEQNTADSDSDDDVFRTVVEETDGHTLETFILLEFCDRGSLLDGIRNGIFLSGPGNAFEALLLTAKDVAHALSYLHSMGILHGDLKAANVLLKSDSRDSRGFVAKVSDFGLARFENEEGSRQFSGGTVTHMPPELLSEGLVTSAVDVYSFGMLMWEMCSDHREPFPGKTAAEILLGIVQGKRPLLPQSCPLGFANLVEWCWRQDHRQRPNMDAIVKRLQRLHTVHGHDQKALHTQT